MSKMNLLPQALNNETLKRTWLCYSKTTGKVYCFVCKLFGGSGGLSSNGIEDWKHISRTVDEHDQSSRHCVNIVTYSERAAVSGRIDQELL